MNAKVLRRFIGSLLVLSVSMGAGAIEVNRNEIQSAGNSNEVVFRNYSGPHSVINTIEQIREIGSSLGVQVSANPDRAGTIGASNRYAVIHAIDPNEKEKFDADIFIIGRNATVDHITNLRRIISAYLSSAYGYSVKDADTIATFATVYNAVYRGNLDYFKTRYKDVVIKNLSSSIVGLSTNYEDWPGRTQIVIPLSDLSGGLSTIDTSAISDKEVIKSMQGEDDKGIDARKDMVDLKEREADNVQEKADEAQAKADEEKAKLTEEQKKQAEADKAASDAQKDADKAKADADKAKADADKAKADADKAKADADKAKKDAAAANKNASDAQKQADQAKKNAAANPNDETAQKKAADEQKKADEAKKEAAEAQAKSNDAQKEATDSQKQAEQAQKEAADSQKQAEQAQKEAKNAQQAADEQSKKTESQAQTAESAQKEADKVQEKADQKRSEAQDERTSIAKDQQTLINESSQTNSEDIMYGLKNVDEAGLTSEIVKMNSKTGLLIKESPVTQIRGRTVYDDGDNFIAIAGSNIGKGAVRLVQISKQNLEMVKESNEKLSETSVLVERDGSYYCTIQDGSDFYIGKFNSNIENQLKSKVKVKAATPITITAKGILVNDANNTPIILNPSDLSSISPESQADNRNIIQKAADSAANITK